MHLFVVSRESSFQSTSRHTASWENRFHIHPCNPKKITTFKHTKISRHKHLEPIISEGIQTKKWFYQLTTYVPFCVPFSFSGRGFFECISTFQGNNTVSGYHQAFSSCLRLIYIRISTSNGWWATRSVKENELPLLVSTWQYLFRDHKSHRICCKRRTTRLWW